MVPTAESCPCVVNGKLMILESVLPNRTSNIISNKTHNTSAAFIYHPILSKYPRHNTNASPLTINELATVDRKYPK